MTSALITTRPRVTEVIASSVDRTFGSVVLKYGGRSKAEKLAAEERVRRLEEIVDQYEDPALVEKPGRFFLHPRDPDGVQERVRGRRGARTVVDVSWDSNYEPFSRDIGVLDRYSKFPRNHRAHARVWRSRGGGRPVVILLHGYLGGVHAFERYIWPVDRYLKLGFDVALFVLPHHGVRGATYRAGIPAFPDSDPRFNIEGFRQSIHDLRTFVRWLDRRGATTIGVMGMSLGGYTSALLATVEPRLGFVVPVIPLVSIPAFARARGRLNGDEATKARQYELLERVYRVVSPLARRAIVPQRGRLVVAGDRDRITPVTEAQRLAEHFSAPLETFRGSHLVHLGRGRAFGSIERMWKALGVKPESLLAHTR